MASGNDATLDLTNAHLKDLQNIEISTVLTHLDLTANRLKDIDPRILALTGLQSLNLRQNLVEDAGALETCSFKCSLQDLELRDNQLQQIPALHGFSQLRRLEVSYNQIRSLEPLAALAEARPPLQELYVAANKVTAITCLDTLSQLQVLELGSNRLREVAGLEAQGGCLRELWLGRNRISAAANLGHLTSLVRLSLQSNRLDSMSGLEGCTSLEELYLSHNGITRIEGLAPLTRLKVLDISSNHITTVEGLEAQSQLEDLWLNDNRIPSLEGLQAALAAQTDSLSVIYLEGNPCAQEPSYRQRLLDLLPRLTQLDADVLPEQRQRLKQQA